MKVSIQLSDLITVTWKLAEGSNSGRKPNKSTKRMTNDQWLNTNLPFLGTKRRTEKNWKRLKKTLN